MPITHRVAFITNVPAPYRIPTFRALQEIPDIDLTVLFMAPLEPNRNASWVPELAGAGFRNTVMSGIHIPFFNKEWTLHANFGVIGHLRRVKPQVVVCGGYDAITTLLALVYCKLAGIPCVLWYESTQASAAVQTGQLHRLKWLLVRQFTAYLVPGLAARRNIEQHLPGSAQRIYYSPNSVDNAVFAVARHFSPGELAELKQSFGVHAKVVLFTGRFIPLKGIDTLVVAFASVLSRHPDTILVLVGDGPMRPQLEALVSTLGLQGKVVFAGMRSQKELPRFYAVADVAVMPSRREVWGLVVNEAMAAGRAVIVSNVAGCVADLVQEGVNGFTVPPDDAAALSNAIERVLFEPGLQQRMAQASLEMVNDLSPVKTAMGIAQCVRSLVTVQCGGGM